MLGAMPVLSQLHNYVAASQLMAQAIALCPQLLENLTAILGRAHRDADSQSSGSETYQQDSGRPAKKARKLVQEEKVCSNCATSNTPFWRKDAYSKQPLCNACGLYKSKAGLFPEE
eukprot:jgi/Astpho2/3065/Aster-x0141